MTPRLRNSGRLLNVARQLLNSPRRFPLKALGLFPDKPPQPNVAKIHQFTVLDVPKVRRRIPVSGNSGVLQPIMPLDLPVKVRPWELKEFRCQSIFSRGIPVSEEFRCQSIF